MGLLRAPARHSGELGDEAGLLIASGKQREMLVFNSLLSPFVLPAPSHGLHCPHSGTLSFREPALKNVLSDTPQASLHLLVR